MFIRSERFRDARTEYNQHGEMSLLTAAAQSGVDKSFLSRAENDDTCSLGVEKVAQLARFYGVTTDYLLGLSDVPYAKDASLEAAIVATGLSYDAIANISSAHTVLLPEAFSALEFLLSKKELSSFLASLSSLRDELDENISFGKDIVSALQNAVASGTVSHNGNPHQTDSMTVLNRTIEGILWNAQIYWSEYLKGYIDFDAAREAVVVCRQQCNSVINAYKEGDPDAE